MSLTKLMRQHFSVKPILRRNISLFSIFFATFLYPRDHHLSPPRADAIEQPSFFSDQANSVKFIQKTIDGIRIF